MSLLSPTGLAAHVAGRRGALLLTLSVSVSLSPSPSCSLSLILSLSLSPFTAFNMTKRVVYDSIAKKVSTSLQDAAARERALSSPRCRWEFEAGRNRPRSTFWSFRSVLENARLICAHLSKSAVSRPKSQTFLSLSSCLRWTFCLRSPHSQNQRRRRRRRSELRGGRMRERNIWPGRSCPRTGEQGHLFAACDGECFGKSDTYLSDRFKISI